MTRLHTVYLFLLLLSTTLCSAAAPAGAAEKWAVGSTHVLRFAEAPLTDATVQLEYRAGGGGEWSTADVTPGASGPLWIVPNLPAGACTLRARVGEREIAELDLEVIPSQRADYQWARIHSAAPFAPRDGAGALTMAGKMWLIGGWHPKGPGQPFPRICTNEVWSSRDGKDWVLEKPNSFLDDRFDPTADWEGRHTAGYVVHQDKLWIVGGDPIQGHYQSDVWNSVDGKRWTHVNPGKPVPWGPRVLHYTVAHDGWIWVMGGQTLPPFVPGEERFYRDVWRSKDGVNWDEVTPKEPFWPQRGMIGGSAVLNGRMWVLGGGTYDTPKAPTRKYYNDVWSSADGVRWERHAAHAPWAPRQYHDVAVFDDKLWVMEGYSGVNRNDVWYSSDGVNWYEVPNTPWKPRHAASVFVHDGSLWMVAGNNLESDVWRLSAARAAGRENQRPAQ